MLFKISIPLAVWTKPANAERHVFGTPKENSTMNQHDKKEKPASPPPQNPQAEPVSHPTGQQPGADPQQSDDATDGDYVVVGSGLGIDE
ncbi:hypothetical protein SAMN05444008_11246 [Cnuella takakiae]|uniref:Uncharacterized protein n=1 Tax=Cnuella takakiae TaxID=1302690 RepID=A0A1M5EHI5_9BACT|nr:hypothetical protein [Cnuella takakiae]OLY91177.1 hypothetical protein BUE76_04135 [Cnuella takakiae]SHF78610.1 hypothetical protein SAMN05444008_11246 [Cnuella takakiae]